jgi:cytidine deaminase
VLAEFGLETVVVIADEEGNLKLETTVAELLPGSFGSLDLQR